MLVPAEALLVAIPIAMALGYAIRTEKTRIVHDRNRYLQIELAAAERDLRAQQSRVPWGYRRPKGLVTERPARPHYVADPTGRPPSPTRKDLAEWTLSLNGKPWYSTADGQLMDVIEEGDATPRLAPSEPPSAARLRRMVA